MGERFQTRFADTIKKHMSGGGNYPNSCRSRFSGVCLVFEVFQAACRSNKENPSVYWNAALSCPFMASNMQIRISFRSRSGC